MENKLYKGLLLENYSPMPRIKREDLISDTEKYLDRIDLSGDGYVIIEEEKQDLVLCPAKWFSYCFDFNFHCFVVAAVRYALRRDTYMPEAVTDFIIKNINIIDYKTIQILIRDIENEFEYYPSMPQKERWIKFVNKLNERGKYIEEQLGNER